MDRGDRMDALTFANIFLKTQGAGGSDSYDHYFFAPGWGERGNWRMGYVIV